MTMHPGAYLATAYLAPLGLSGDELTQLLNVPTLEVSKLILQEAPLTAAMALRLEAVFAKPAEEWLRMQLEYDIEQARKSTDVSALTRCSRLNELWLTGIPEHAGNYLWREGPGREEHRVELFYQTYQGQEDRSIRCYSLTGVTFDDYARGQWRLA
jgi:addiction module HigA family antidote